MRKMLMLVALLGLTVLFAASCGRQKQTEQTPNVSVDTTQKVRPAAAVYYCPMDTEIVLDKAGKCSKCGMDLIERPAETK